MCVIKALKFDDYKNCLEGTEPENKKNLTQIALKKLKKNS